jgi:hypothetical protein
MDKQLSNDGKQFVPPSSATPKQGKGKYGGSAPAKSKRYDTATNSFRGMKPKGGKVGQGKGLNGKGHDGKFGAPDGGYGRDGRVGGTGPVSQGDFNQGGVDAPVPSAGKIGRANKINTSSFAGSSGQKLRPSRVG